MAVLLSLSAPPTKPPQNPRPNPNSKTFLRLEIASLCNSSKRDFAFKTAAISVEEMTSKKSITIRVRTGGINFEDYSAGLSSPDGLEVLSVVIRPSIQLKTTFLEVGNIYSARSIKIKEDEGFRTYYFYEFGIDEQHVVLVAAINSGKAFVAGAAAPQSKWDDDGVQLHSAALSLSVLWSSIDCS